jgi:hypothetical protein
MDNVDSDKENEFPEVTSDVPAKWMASNKGRPLLVDPYNYVYVKMKDYKGKTYWRCQRDQSKLCER